MGGEVLERQFLLGIMHPEKLHRHATAATLRLVIDCQPKSVNCGLGRGFVRVLSGITDLTLAVSALPTSVGFPPSINPDVRPSFSLFEL